MTIWDQAEHWAKAAPLQLSHSKDRHLPLRGCRNTSSKGGLEGKKEKKKKEEKPHPLFSMLRRFYSRRSKGACNKMLPWQVLPKECSEGEPASGDFSDKGISCCSSSASLADGKLAWADRNQKEFSFKVSYCSEFWCSKSSWGRKKKKKKPPKNQTQPTSVRSTKHQLSVSFSPAFSAQTWQNTKTVAWWAQSSCLSKPCVIQWHSASTSLAGMFQPDEITQKCEIKQQ